MNEYWESQILLVDLAELLRKTKKKAARGKKSYSSCCLCFKILIVSLDNKSSKAFQGLMISHDQHCHKSKSVVSESLNVPFTARKVSQRLR